MTAEEKICPIMSRPHITYSQGNGMMMTATNGEFLCCREKCMAWSSETSVGYCRLIGVRG
jgi:hypothetical protein